MNMFKGVKKSIKKYFTKEELIEIKRLENRLKEESNKTTRLENKIKEESNKTTRLENRLKEESNKTTRLENKLKEESGKYWRLKNELNQESKKITGLEAELGIWKKGAFPPGHFYSPTFQPEEIDKNINNNFLNPHVELLGININDDKQKELLSSFKRYYGTPEFPISQNEEFLYWHDNVFFGYSDSITLSCIIQHFKPKRIIEVGSGFSSAVMMDVNDKVMQNDMSLTFIEPYPEERLSKIITQNTGYTLIKDVAQNIPVDSFKELQSNDILFIDSSHVGKYGSDVLYLLFNVLPVLNPGVIIHFHDIFYPFEYPYAWLKQGRFWNESYYLRALLMYNNHFEILFHSSYLEKKYTDWYKENMPKCLSESYSLSVEGKEIPVETQGQSIYIRKKK